MTSFRLVFLFACLQLTFSQFSPSCSKDLIQNNVTVIMKDIGPFVLLSGKGIGQYGDYDACQRSYRYALLKVQLDQGIGPTIGLCITEQCSMEELNQNVYQLKKFIIDNHLDKDLPFNLSTAQFTIYDPLFIYPDLGFGTFATVLLLILLAILSLIIPFIQLKKRMTFVPVLVQTINERFPQNNIQTLGQQSMMSQQSSLDIPRRTGSIRQETYNEDLSFFKHFSLTHNCTDLFRLGTPDPNLSIFNGYRALSFIMVVMGHEFICLIFSDFGSFEVIKKRSFSMVLVDCFFAVDAFFWMGGFFLGFIFAETKKIIMIRKQGWTFIPIALINRVLRLWPCYIIVILICANVASYMGDGPKWDGAIEFFGNCSSTWWQNLLFITIYQTNNSCVPWAWYLDNDIQLFFVGVTLMYLYATVNQYIGKIFIVLLLAATQITGTIITFQNEYKLPYFQQFDADQSFFRDYYIKPWCRGPPYFLGLLVGVLYREHKNYLNQEEQHRARTLPMLSVFYNFARRDSLHYYFFIAFNYSLGGLLILWLSFGWRDALQEGVTFWPNWVQECYWAFCRILYTLGMTFLVIPNLVGLPDWFNTSVMSNAFFRFVAKLSFTGYLFHFIILIYILEQIYEGIQFAIFDGLSLFLGTFVLTLFIATIATLIVEMPFTNIANLFVKRPTENNTSYVKIHC